MGFKIVRFGRRPQKGDRHIFHSGKDFIVNKSGDPWTHVAIHTGHIFMAGAHPGIVGGSNGMTTCAEGGLIGQGDWLVLFLSMIKSSLLMDIPLTFD